VREPTLPQTGRSMRWGFVFSWVLLVVLLIVI
jgi:hypothetical protein